MQEGGGEEREKESESLMALWSPGLLLGFCLHGTEINFYLVFNDYYFSPWLLNSLKRFLTDTGTTLSLKYHGHEWLRFLPHSQDMDYK